MPQAQAHPGRHRPRRPLLRRRRQRRLHQPELHRRWRLGLTTADAAHAPVPQYFSCRKISHTQTALNPDTAISQMQNFPAYGWGVGNAAQAVLARDALASSVDKQHEDDDEAVDQMSLSETQSCWQLISNRAMLLPYARG